MPVTPGCAGIRGGLVQYGELEELTVLRRELSVDLCHLDGWPHLGHQSHHDSRLVGRGGTVHTGSVGNPIVGFDRQRGDTAVLDAKGHLHEHEERRSGTTLLLLDRTRLDTDRGLYVASGEGYRATAALSEAAAALERQLRDDKGHGRTKKHPDAAYWERRWGWSSRSDDSLRPDHPSPPVPPHWAAIERLLGVTGTPVTAPSVATVFSPRGKSTADLYQQGTDT